MSIEEKVLKILKNVFDLDWVDRTCSQETCEAWDSLGLLNLAVELESEFDVSFEPDEIGQMKSFDSIVKVLMDKGITK